MKNGKKRLLLVVIATLGSGVFFELAARVASLTFLKEKIEQTDLRTRLERIYRPPMAEKEEDSLRVFVYGGSTVQGLPWPKVGMVAMLDYQLHHLFQEQKPVQVYNFGWSGYNSSLVRHYLTETVEYQPDLLIVYTGHNEFIYPQLDWYPLMKFITGLKNKSALVKVFLTFQRPSGEEVEEPINEKRPAYRENEWYYAIKMAIFRQNLRAVKAMAQQAKIPVIFVVPAANLADWPPVSREVTTLERADHEEPRSIYQRAQSLIKDDPSAAHQLFIQAKDEDYLPWRSSSDQNDLIRSLGDGETVWVADAEAKLSAQSPEGLIGSFLILDNVHPTIEGNYLIVQSILEVIEREKMIQSDWWRETWPVYSLEELLERLDYSAEDELEINVKTARYCLKNPFFNFSAAKMYLDRAEKIKADDWRISGLRAVIAFLENDRKRAAEDLAAAQSLAGENWETEAEREIPYLRQLP